MCAQAAAFGLPRCCETILQGNHTVPAAFRQILSSQSVEAITAGEKSTISTKEKRNQRTDFLKKINAILNAGFGFVLVHLDDTSVMNCFNEQVNFPLDQMIADNSYFHENFVWKHYDKNDEKHILFWIKQKHRKHVSTLEVNTKVSWNGSLRDAKPGQLRSHVKRTLREEPMETAESAAFQPDDTQTGPRGEKFTFKEGEEVMIGKLAFQESIDQEAKSKPKDVEMSDLVDWLLRMENGGKLPGYITAFAKLEDGGSYFVGIAEEKESPPSEKRTGRFICEGISPTGQEREQLCHKIKDGVKEKMMWLTEEPLEELVSVHFHEVEVDVEAMQTRSQAASMQPRSTTNTEQNKNKKKSQAAVDEKLYVMEVKVNHADGIGFCHEDGPQAFTIMTAEDPVQAEQTSTGEIAGAPKPGTSTGISAEGLQNLHRVSKRKARDTSSPIPEKMAPTPSAEPHPMAIAEWVKLNGGAERLAKLCNNSRLAL